MSIVSKWNTKKKILVSLSVVVICCVAAGILYYIFKPEDGIAVTLATVNKNNVTQTLDTTGTVESANQGVFEILDNTKVVNVNVRVGDKIKKGEVLAAFDISSLQNLVSEKQKACNSAYETYNNFKSTSKSSAGELVQLEKEISSLESEISKLEAIVAAQDDKTDTNSTSADSAAIQNLVKMVSSVLGESSSNSQITAMISRLLSSGSSTSQISSILSGILNGGSSTGFDLSSLTGMSDDETKLTSDQLQLVELKAKQTLLKTQTNSTLESTYKTVYESSHDALISTKAAVEQLSKGWIAKDDGIVREVNIKAGQIYKNTSKINTNVDLSTLLNTISSNSEVTNLIKEYFKTTSNGMIVEYYPFVASFILGKYDVLKVSMDQNAVITSPKGTLFDGKITYISPVASSSSSINISSILGTSGSSNGVEAKVSIPKPDESIIIGFDVDISIAVDSAKNATVIPVEALQFDSENSYVFIYNQDTNTVKKSVVKTGIFSGSLYQIVSGCKVGDKIVKAPSLTLKDGDKVTVRADG